MWEHGAIGAAEKKWVSAELSFGACSFGVLKRLHMTGSKHAVTTVDGRNPAPKKP